MSLEIHVWHEGHIYVYVVISYYPFSVLNVEL